MIFFLLHPHLFGSNPPINTFGASLFCPYSIQRENNLFDGLSGVFFCASSSSSSFSCGQWCIEIILFSFTSSLSLFWHLWGTNLNFSNAKVLKSECQKKSTATTTIIAIIPTQDLKFVDLMFFEDCPSKRSIDCNSITQVIWYRTFSLRILIEYIWTMPKPSTSNPIWHKWIERKRQNKVQIVKSYEKHRAMGKKFLENFYRDNENEVKLNCIVGKWLLLKCGIKLEPITFPISNESN